MFLQVEFILVVNLFNNRGGFQKIGHNFESYEALSIEMNFQKWMCESKLFNQMLREKCPYS